MRNFFFYYFAVLIFLSSCKKIETQTAQSSNAITASKAQSPSTLKPGPTPDVVQPTYWKFDLQSQGGGVYAGLATDQHGSQHSVTVDGIFYKTLDDFGNPIPVRDGDPIYGTLHVSYSDGGSSVIIQPNGTDLQNHFAVNYGVLGSSFGTVNLYQYNSNYSTAYNNYMTAYTLWRANNFLGPTPTLIQPNILDNFVPSDNGAHIETYTGKLIRSTTASTTFALGSENYPAPVPPAQYVVGYWLSGSTKIYVFVSTSNGSLVVKGSINTVTSTLYTATGSFNPATNSVSNFSMTVGSTPYHKTGSLDSNF
jgi:hypothetical protein